MCRHADVLAPAEPSAIEAIECRVAGPVLNTAMLLKSAKFSIVVENGLILDLTTHALPISHKPDNDDLSGLRLNRVLDCMGKNGRAAVKVQDARPVLPLGMNKGREISRVLWLHYNRVQVKMVEV